MSSDSHWLDNPLHQADQTFRWQVFDDWASVPGDADTYAYHSLPQPTAFGFTELLPSWNPTKRSDDQYLTLWVRTRNRATQAWSPWLYIGQWGDAPSADRTTVFEHGQVAVDILELDQPADAFQLTVEVGGLQQLTALQEFVCKISVVTSGPADDAPAALIASLDNSDRGLIDDKAWQRDLPVGFLPQRLLPEPLWSRGCSPTATAMVLQYRDIESSTPAQTARSVYDTEHDIYGNWGRAVAYAGSLGLDAELARFRTWDQVKAAIARGQPIIASIRFEAGEFPSNPMDETNGHLIVIRGLTKDGDAIVNDSAFADQGNGIIYKAEELARAWLGKGGVAYLIGEPR